MSESTASNLLWYWQILLIVLMSIYVAFGSFEIAARCNSLDFTKKLDEIRDKEFAASYLKHPIWNSPPVWCAWNILQFLVTCRLMGSNDFHDAWRYIFVVLGFAFMVYIELPTRIRIWKLDRLWKEILRGPKSSRSPESDSRRSD